MCPQAVCRLDMISGRGQAQQTQARLRVDGRAAPVEECDGERSGGVQIAGIRRLAVPVHGLDIVAGNATASSIHSPQAVHDVRIAAVGQTLQYRQELFTLPGGAPHLHECLAAGHHGRDALMQIVDARNDPAVETNDDVAEADAGPIGRAAARSLEEQGAIGVLKAEGEGQR